MPKVGRLKKRPDFLEVAGARVKWVTPGLILQARRRTCRDTDAAAAHGRRDGQEVRVGFTVSRKVGGAVQRNRARRRLRAAVAAVLPECGQAGYDYVLIGRAGTLERPYAALLTDLRTALRRVAGGGRKQAPEDASRRPKVERDDGEGG